MVFPDWIENLYISLIDIEIYLSTWIWLRPAVSNTRPTRGSNAARKHLKIQQFLKVYRQFAYFFNYF